MTNADPIELEKFGELAYRWWDPNGDFKPLHDINPCRVDYIDGIVALAQKEILDVGCGGGLLTEAMAARGAVVTGIDLSGKPLKIAELHLIESGLRVTYQNIAAEDLARERPSAFDAVTCLEMLEHVPDPASVVTACATLTKRGGHVFFSTLNRNLKSYALAVIGAEYVLRLLPRGTHDYARFIKPSELARMCRSAGLDVRAVTGMQYNPFTRVCTLGADASVNYLIHAVKP
jgi:2-polyprenyl-6-hydroxyphenyl methylase/3-demethylubiquinone-9 3-methyltransferase